MSTIGSNTGENKESDESDKDENEKDILSICFNPSTFAAAIYDQKASKIVLMCDKNSIRRGNCLIKLISQIDPTFLLIRETQFDLIFEHLKDWKIDESVFLKRLPNSFYDVKAAKNKIQQLVDAKTESNLFKSTEVPLIQATGALLKHLEQLADGQTNPKLMYPILGFDRINIDKQLRIDVHTLKALNVFRREFKTLSLKNPKHVTKECFSLFNLINNTKSKIGWKLMKHWFMKPLSDVAQINERLDAVEALKQPEYLTTIQSIRSHISKLKPVSKLIQKMKCSMFSASDWSRLQKMFYHSWIVCDTCQTLPQNICIMKMLASVKINKLTQMAMLISSTIDTKESAKRGIVVIKEGVDINLDEKKKKFSGLSKIMTENARREMLNLPSFVTECSLIYLPQLGYLLTIPAELFADNSDYLIDDLDFLFVANEFAHYKSRITREMDDTIGDIKFEIMDAEVNVILALQEAVKPNLSTLYDVTDILAALDCILAFSISANLYNLKRPTIVQTECLEIVNGRHLLQECKIDNIVPNDANFEDKKIMLITGPNASGKSIFIKQIGLIVFLSHVGSFVPAESAKIGIFDSIFSRIMTNDSVGSCRSAFFNDLSQIVPAFTNSTRNSLVLIDEFGKGTHHIDAVSLLASMINFWNEKNENCPFVLISTDLYEIFNKDIITNLEKLLLKKMETVCVNNQVSYSYRLVPGISLQSYSFNVAKICGVPNGLLEKAQGVLNKLEGGQTLIQVMQNDQPQNVTNFKGFIREILSLSGEGEEFKTKLKAILDKYLNVV